MAFGDTIGVWLCVWLRFLKVRYQISDPPPVSPQALTNAAAAPSSELPSHSYLPFLLASNRIFITAIAIEHQFIIEAFCRLNGLFCQQNTR